MTQLLLMAAVSSKKGCLLVGVKSCELPTRLEVGFVVGVVVVNKRALCWAALCCPADALLVGCCNRDTKRVESFTHTAQQPWTCCTHH